MAERDPFGRLPDENPLAGLGSLSDGIDSQAPAQPVVSDRRPKPAGNERRHGGSAADAPDERWRGVSAADAATSPETERAQANPRPAATSAAAGAQTLRDLLGAVEQGQRTGAGRGAARGSASGGGDAGVMQVFRVIGRVARVIRFVVVLAIVVAVGSIIAAGVFTSESIKDRIGDIPNIELPSTDLGGPKPEAGRDPVGLSERSLLLRSNLAPALRRMRTSGLGRLKSMSIRPERIDAQLLTKDGRLRSVQQRFDGKLTEVNVSGGGFGALPTIPFARANSAAPGRLARSAAGRVKRPLSDVDYVVLLNADSSSVWTVVMKQGGQFLGDARGRITRRIG